MGMGKGFTNFIKIAKPFKEMYNIVKINNPPGLSVLVPLQFDFL